MDIFAKVGRIVSIVSAPSAPRRRRSARLSFQMLESRELLTSTPAQFLNPHAVSGDQFASNISTLPNGNVLILAPNDNAGGTSAGAVYLFNGQTGALISTLQGSHAGDLSATKITILSNGNFVINDSSWNGGLGAVIWGSGTTGVSGTISASNSLVGSNAGDNVGGIVNEYGNFTTLIDGVTALSNGNYVVDSPNWNNSRGAVTFGNGITGVSGVVGSSNSLVGSNAGDQVGSNDISTQSNGIKALSNGNYIVASAWWNHYTGAVTFGSGVNGVSGVVGSSNSLVGSRSDDWVGSSGITTLSNGNYVVDSYKWNNFAGAVTFGNGVTGVSGTISSSNSLVGSNAGDNVGFNYVTVLSNGNYVVSSPNWNNSRGAVTFGNGVTGVSGTISASNSLVGSNAGDNVGGIVNEYGNFTTLIDGVTALSNGNYVVDSPTWNNSRGAVTFGNGVSGVTGVVGPGNSLVGIQEGNYSGDIYSGDRLGSEGVRALSNGNYVVVSSKWNNSRGAVTFGNGVTGVSGAISSSNSLVGSHDYDNVGGGFYDSLLGFGIGAITVLSNGNYVVDSPNWDNSAGAVTFGDGVHGVTGVVGSSNSLIGSHNGDMVGGSYDANQGAIIGGVTVLSNGNYLVSSPYWNKTAGAVTFGDGVHGVTGVVGSSNSLVGSHDYDDVGGGFYDFSGFEIGGISVLSNGNYVVDSPGWDNSAGAVTFGNGVTGVTGVVGSSNSLVGSHKGDSLGSYLDDFGDQRSGMTVLSNGNYVVDSPDWNNSIGAVTFGNGVTGVTGVVGSSNSLVGSHDKDAVGFHGVEALSNGSYVVNSSDWNSSTGAVTFGSDVNGVTGVVGPSNSLVGSHDNDQVGSAGVTDLGNGNYLVRSNLWYGERGAVTFVNGATGMTGVVESSNSLVGSNAGDQVGNDYSYHTSYWNGVTVLNNHNYVVGIPTWDGGIGAVTFGSGATGVSGVVSAGNSLVGKNAGDEIGSGSVTALGNGNYVVVSPSWNHIGVVTFSSGLTGVVGLPTTENSVFGQTSSTTDGYVFVVSDNQHGRFYASFPDDGTGYVYRASATTGFASTPTITVTDAGGVATGNPYPASTTVTGGDGSTIPGTTTFTYYVGGKATGTGTSTAPKNAGTYTVVANFFSRDSHYADSTSAPMTFQITPGAPSQLVLSTVPTTGTAGTKLASFAAMIEDVFGNVVNSDTSTVTIRMESSPGAYTTEGTFAVIAVAGVATFSNLTFKTAGDYKIAVTDGSLTAPVATSVPKTIQITPGAPSQVVFSTVPATGTAGTKLTSVIALIKDKFGNVVRSDTSTVTISVKSGPGNFTTDGTLTASSAAGVATFSNLTLHTAGVYELTVTDGSLAASVSGILTINHAAASKLVFTKVPLNGRPHMRLSALTVSVEDPYGNIVTDSNSSVRLAVYSSTFARRAFTSDSTRRVAVENGVATFTHLKLQRAGIYKLKATDGSLTPAVSGKLVISDRIKGIRHVHLRTVNESRSIDKILKDRGETPFLHHQSRRGVSPRAVYSRGARPR